MFSVQWTILYINWSFHSHRTIIVACVFIVKIIFLFFQSLFLTSYQDQTLDRTYVFTEFVCTNFICFDCERSSVRRLTHIKIISSFRLWDNSVHLHIKCSPLWVGIITFNKDNYHVYCLM